ncbi:MAG: TonB-dependent receptor [Crocinitomicaceae bacterium]|nr:TonB-dependent receptor [Crocinitomicaceae bacterium]
MKRIQTKYLLLVIITLFTITGIAQMKVQFISEQGESIVDVKTYTYSIKGESLSRDLSNLEGQILISSDVITNHSSVRIQAQSLGFKTIDTIINVQPEIILFLIDDVLQQKEVVVTAQYNKQLAENSVHRIKVIDREKIDAMGAVNLRDALRNELGVRLSQDNILGSSMTLQGISGENVKILIDGVPVIGRLGGNIDISQINLQEIDHIEIVEGPLSVNYGTNALAGVINLISKKSVFKQVNGSASKYYESIGHYNVSGEINYGRRFHSFGISLGRNLFDGWRDDHSTFNNPIPIADSNRFMTWKPKEQLFGGAYFQWNKNSWLVKAKLNAFNEFILNRGYPRAPYLETAFDDEYNTRRIDKSLIIKKNLKNKGLINTLFSYNRYDRIKNTFFVDLTTLDRQLTNSPSDQDTSVFDQWVFRGNYTSSRDSAKLNFQVGYDILIESALGKRILDTRQEQGDFALFTTAEYQPIKSLIIRPGLRYAYNTTYNPPLLPSLNMKWKFSKRWNWRASYARGFRAPGIKELYFEFIDINHNIVGNQNLRAESSHNFSSSFVQKLNYKKWNIESEINGFYNTITDRISLASIEGTKFSYVNIGEFQSTGVRFTTKLITKNIITNAGLGWIGRASNLLSESVSGQYLFYPEIQTSILYSIPKSKTSIALFYKYQGRLPNFILNEEGNIEQGITQDYHLLDLTVTQDIWKKRLSLTVGAKNILDITQVESNASTGVHSNSTNFVSVGTGRTYFATLKINLKKSFKDRTK